VFTQNLVGEPRGQKKPATIYEYNVGTIFLVKNQQVSSRTKHIDIRHHFIRDLQDKKEVDVRFKRSENNAADIMTNNTTRDVHDKHTQQVRDGTLPLWKENVKQDDSVTEYTNSWISTESPISSPVTSGPSSSNTTSDTVKSRKSKKPLESKAGGQSACILL
jgi:hypothetical protein